MYTCIQTYTQMSCHVPPGPLLYKGHAMRRTMGSTAPNGHLFYGSRCSSLGLVVHDLIQAIMEQPLKVVEEYASISSQTACSRI